MVAFIVFVLLVIIILLVNTITDKYKIGFKLIILLTSLYWGVTYLDTVDMPGYVDLYGLLVKGIKPDIVLWGLSYRSFEPAFLYLMQFFVDIGCPFYVFQTCLLLFESILLGVGLYRLLNNYKLATILIVAISLYLPFWLMAAMRQGIPIAVFCFVLPDIINGKYIKALIYIAVASLFHSSGFFLILLILLYRLYKWFVVSFDHHINLLLFYSIILVSCDIIYLFGLSLSDYLDKITMTLFSDNPFIYRDYTIMSNSENSNYGILKLLEMNVIFILSLFAHKQENKDKSYYLLEALFLIYFVVNTIAGGIIIHRLSYFLVIPYYLLFYKELHFFTNRIKAPGLDAIVFVLYMFFLFFRQYQPFTTYLFEYFTA